MNNKHLLRNALLYTDSTSPNSLDINYKINTQQPSVSFSKETLIPLSILKNNSSLEAMVFYLKEILGLKFVEIANLLGRDQRTIWVTYVNAEKKKIVFGAEDNIDTNSQLNNNMQQYLPLSIFTSRSFSILETIVFYQKNSQNFSFKEIADTLGKNYRTIWTVYKRALKKVTHEE